jgi:hypothetical protein
MLEHKNKPATQNIQSFVVGEKHTIQTSTLGEKIIVVKG